MPDTLSARAGPSRRFAKFQQERKLPARILIVDDNSLARTTIHGLLDWHSFQVCGEAQDGKDAIGKVIELKPDIVLLDINMPGMNGINAAYEIRRISPSTKIVFLTVHDTPGARHNTKMWSHGFVAKASAGTELIPILNRLTGADMEAAVRPARTGRSATTGQGSTTGRTGKSRRVRIVKRPKEH